MNTFNINLAWQCIEQTCINNKCHDFYGSDRIDLKILQAKIEGIQYSIWP